LLSIVVSMSPWFMKPLMFIGTAPMKAGLTGPRMKAQLKWAEEKLGEDDYFMGKNPGRCDFLLSYPMDVLMHRKMVDVKEFPRMRAWYERYQARDAWKRSLNKGNGYDWTCEFLLVLWCGCGRCADVVNSFLRRDIRSIQPLFRYSGWLIRLVAMVERIF